MDIISDTINGSSFSGAIVVSEAPFIIRNLYLVEICVLWRLYQQRDGSLQQSKKRSLVKQKSRVEC